MVTAVRLKPASHPKTTRKTANARYQQTYRNATNSNTRHRTRTPTQQQLQQGYPSSKYPQPRSRTRHRPRRPSPDTKTSPDVGTNPTLRAVPSDARRFQRGPASDPTDPPPTSHQRASKYSCRHMNPGRTGKYLGIVLCLVVATLMIALTVRS